MFLSLGRFICCVSRDAFIRVGLLGSGRRSSSEWVVIPIHWPNLISPTVPSYYTLPPTTCVQALVGEGGRSEVAARLTKRKRGTGRGGVVIEGRIGAQTENVKW